MGRHHHRCQLHCRRAVSPNGKSLRSPSTGHRHHRRGHCPSSAPLPNIPLVLGPPITHWPPPIGRPAAQKPSSTGPAPYLCTIFHRPPHCLRDLFHWPAPYTSAPISRPAPYLCTIFHRPPHCLRDLFHWPARIPPLPFLGQPINSLGQLLWPLSPLPGTSIASIIALLSLMARPWPLSWPSSASPSHMHFLLSAHPCHAGAAPSAHSSHPGSNTLASP
jgi:hypothetical protein